jgi:putative ABC transport system permease protein
MSETEISWLGLAASLVLVAAAIGLSAWHRLDLGRDMAWASARALVQLLVVGYALVVVVDDDAPIALAWLWVVLMVPFAAWTVRRRAPEVPGAFSLSLVSTGAGAAVSLGVIFGLGIFDMTGRTVVPLAGMMIGNAMKDAVVAGRRIVEEMADKRPEVEARLALGQPWPEASRPHVRAAMRTALISQIETTKAVGLVFLPGAMTGLILAGVDPLDAVRVQAAIMFLILGAVATNVIVIGRGLTRRLFTPDHRLVELRRAAG